MKVVFIVLIFTSTTLIEFYSGNCMYKPDWVHGALDHWKVFTSFFLTFQMLTLNTFKKNFEKIYKFWVLQLLIRYIYTGIPVLQLMFRYIYIGIPVLQLLFRYIYIGIPVPQLLFLDIFTFGFQFYSCCF